MYAQEYVCVSVCAGTNPRWFVVCMSVWVYGLAFLSVALPWSGKALQADTPRSLSLRVSSLASHLRGNLPGDGSWTPPC